MNIEDTEKWYKSMIDADHFVLPHKVGNYIIVLKDSDESTSGYYDGECWVINGECHNIRDVVYWKKFPKSPKE